jgi:hypothetical protein
MDWSKSAARKKQRREGISLPNSSFAWIFFPRTPFSSTTEVPLLRIISIHLILLPLKFPEWNYAQSCQKLFQSPILIPKFLHSICDIGKDIQKPMQDNLVLIFFRKPFLFLWTSLRMIFCSLLTKCFVTIFRTLFNREMGLKSWGSKVVSIFGIRVMYIWRVDTF